MPKARNAAGRRPYKATDLSVYQAFIGPAKATRWGAVESPDWVAWPDRPEVKRYSIIVIITVVVYTALVGGLDFVFSEFSQWFYSS